MLFNFHTIVNFPNFLLLLIFNIIPLWLENIFCIISILLNLLRLISWPNLWSVLENVSYALEKNVRYPVLGWIVLSMWLRSSWFIVFFIFCFLVELLCSCSIIRSSVLKSPVIIFDLFISVFSSVSFCFLCFESVVMYIYGYNCYVLLISWPLYRYKRSFLCL